MNVNQIYELVNNINKEAFGTEAITVKDLTGLIATGDKILDSATDKEKFMNALLDRVNKTIISTRVYNPGMKDIVKDTMEFGAIVQKIYVEPFEAIKNDSWDLTSGRALSIGNINPPNVKQFLFSNRNTWQFLVTIPDDQINTAFTSAEGFSAFLSGVYVQLENTIKATLENLTNMTICNFIAEKIRYEKSEDKKGIHAINILKMYNTEKELTLTANDALQSLDFLRYANNIIKMNISRFKNYTKLYNTQQFTRFTGDEDLHVMFLSNFATANSIFLQSDTYNKELLELPLYENVSYWQGLGATASFADVSNINVTTSAGESVEVKGVIGFAFDRDALGVMYNRRKGESFYSPGDNMTQKWEKFDYGFFNDLSENAIVFYMDETEE